MHGVQLEPKKGGSGGKQKYPDIDIENDEVCYEPVQTFKDIKPIFEVTMYRQRNEATGHLDDLDVPIVLDHHPVIKSSIPLK